MFKRFRDGIFRPSSVTSYYGDRWWITLIYSIILIALYVAIPIVNSAAYKYIPNETKTIVMNEAYGQMLDYKIEDGELKITGDKSAISFKVANLTVMIDPKQQILYNPNARPYVWFGKNVVKVRGLGTDLDLNYSKQELLNNLDFNQLSEKNYESWDLLFSAFEKEVNEKYQQLLPLTILLEILKAVGVLAALSLILAAFSKINLQANFGRLWQLTIYILAPLIFGKLFASLYGWTIAYYIGLLLTFSYSNRLNFALYHKGGSKDELQS
ncbi:MAG TPA: DUF1189 family protein [Acholeplasma sp.]|nr:DUF1189 family protein [Acholeplasma sp.]